MTHHGMGPNPFESPEIHQVFASLVDVVHESDRGAVLICTEHASEQLRALFERVAAPGLGRKEVQRQLEYPGPLGSFAARHTIAALSGLIDIKLHTSLGCLRQLRNKAAHGKSAFSLADHQAQLRCIYSLGPAVPQAIRHFACEEILRGTLEHMMEAHIEIRGQQAPLFDEPRAAIDWIRSNAQSLEPLLGPLARLELGIGTAMICALIVASRDVRLRQNELQRSGD
jgi:hypothetical protein